MDEFSAIADDLTAWERNDARNVGDDQAKDGHPNHIVAVERVQAELKQLSVLISVMASAANALERQPLDKALTHVVADFCPQQSGFFTTTDRIAGDSLDNQTLAALHEFSARLEFAQRLTQHLSRKFAAQGSQQAGDFEILADAWRRVCSTLLILSVQLQLNGSAASTDEWSGLVNGLLKNCIEGGAPCLNESGELQIPGWAERRSVARMPMQHVAKASTGGQLASVSIINASEIGLGLAGHAENGQRTTIVLADGRELSGTVKWSDAGRFGLQLDTPLAKSDRLLAAQ